MMSRGAAVITLSVCHEAVQVDLCFAHNLDIACTIGLHPSSCLASNMIVSIDLMCVQHLGVLTTDPHVRDRRSIYVAWSERPVVCYFRYDGLAHYC